MLTYAIFKKEKTDFTWVGAAEELESAKRCIKDLASHSDAEFVVFDQHTMQVVASFENLELLTLKP